MLIQVYLPGAWFERARPGAGFHLLSFGFHGQYETVQSQTIY